MPSASLWAAVPHYVAVAPNPKGALALLRRLESLVGVTVDAQRARDRGGRLRAPGQPRGRVRPRGAGVRRAARAGRRRGGGADRPAQLPSGDVLAREFQRFLRQRGGPGGPAPSRPDAQRAAAALISMRVLFATARGAGRFGAALPFAHACRRAGHDVAVAGPPSVVTLVARRACRSSPSGGAHRTRRRRVRCPCGRGPRRSTTSSRTCSSACTPHRAARDAPDRRAAGGRTSSSRVDGVRVRAGGRRTRRAAGARRRASAVAHRRRRHARGDRRPPRSTSQSSACSTRRCSPARPPRSNEPDEDVLRFRTDAAPRGRQASRSSTSASAPRRRCPRTSRASTGRRSTRSPGFRCGARDDRRSSRPVRARPLAALGPRRALGRPGGRDAARGSDGHARRLGLHARRARRRRAAGVRAAVRRRADQRRAGRQGRRRDRRRGPRRRRAALLDDPSYRRAAGDLAAEIRALPPVDDAVVVIESRARSLA